MTGLGTEFNPYNLCFGQEAGLEAGDVGTLGLLMLKQGSARRIPPREQGLLFGKRKQEPYCLEATPRWQTPCEPKQSA